MLCEAGLKTTHPTRTRNQCGQGMSVWPLATLNSLEEKADRAYLSVSVFCDGGLPIEACAVLADRGGRGTWAMRAAYNPPKFLLPTWLIARLAPYNLQRTGNAAP